MMHFVMTATALLSQVYGETGDPTAEEQFVLEIINRARRNPVGEGVRLQSFSPNPLPGGDIGEGLTAGERAQIGPKPPIAMNSRLLAAARAHSVDMRTRAFFAHTNPTPQTFVQRINGQGYVHHLAGENIAMSTNATADRLEDLLMIDFNYAGRGHRLNLLNLYDPPTSPWREIGVGHHAATTGVVIPPNDPMFLWKDFLTQDFGRRNSVGPFLLGVVYNDSGNAFYNIGEGVSNVALSHDRGPSTAVTASAGGYSCLLPNSATGSVVVTPSGGGVTWGANIQKRRFLTGENIKVDFRTQEATDTDNDGMPDSFEAAYSLSAAGADADGDLATNLDEFRYGSDPTDAASTPTNPDGGVVTPPPPPPSGGGGSSSGGGCGSVGLDLLFPAALLLLVRRRFSRR